MSDARYVERIKIIKTIVYLFVYVMHVIKYKRHRVLVIVMDTIIIKKCVIKSLLDLIFKFMITLELVAESDILGSTLGQSVFKSTVVTSSRKSTQLELGT